METTREELYNQVWTESVSKVARKYNVSDNAFRKKCKEFDIPLPDNRYWGNLKAGKNPIRTPLPIRRENEKIVFVPLMAPNAKISNTQSDFESAFSSYSDSERSILLKIYSSLTVKKTLTQPHNLISQHRDVIKNSSKEKHYYRGDKIDIRGLHISNPILSTNSVSEETLPRIFRFLDALFKAVEKACGSVNPMSQREDSYFIIKGQKISFILKERYNRHKKEVVERWGDNYYYTPSGFVTFSLHTANVRGGRYRDYEWTWKETKTKSLDDRIKEIFKCLFDVPSYIKQELDKYHAAQDEERKLEELKQQAKKRYDDELADTKLLIENSILWERAASIRKYVHHLKETNSSINEQWIEWAENKADWLDPCVDSGEDDYLKEEDKYTLIQDEPEKSNSFYSPFTTSSSYYKKPWYLKNRK